MAKSVSSVTIAIGAILMGIDVIVFLISFFTIFNPFFPADTEGIIVGTLFYCIIFVPPLIIFFVIGLVLLIAGVTIYKANGGDITEDEGYSIKITDETVSKINPEAVSETEGLVICPFCGKEQQKNSFGCIFCHRNF